MQKRTKREQMNSIAAQSYFGVERLERAASLDVTDQRTKKLSKRLPNIESPVAEEKSESSGKFFPFRAFAKFSLLKRQNNLSKL